MQPSITVFTSKNPEHLGKVYSLKDGLLHKETAGFMVTGDYGTVEFNTVNDFAALLESIGTNQAISNSLPRKGLPLSGVVASKKMLPQTPKAIARTKENFNLDHNCRGVLTLDYDPATDSKVLTRDELWSLLQETIPGLDRTGVIWWCSGSSHIFNGETELKGLSGQRVYILIENLSDVPRAVENLNDRLWLKGCGRIMVSSSGAMLERSLFDAAMGESARLDFIGGSICTPPLEQRRGKPVILSAGGWLVTLQALPDLSHEEAEKLASLKLDARDAMQAAAEIAKAAWLASRTDRLTTTLIKAGIEPGLATERGNQAAKSALGGNLLGDWELTLESGEVVTVGQVLDDRERYHNQCTLDPLEPEYLNKKVVGKLYLFGATPTLHSFCRGSTTYKLKRQPARVTLMAGRRYENLVEIFTRLGECPDTYLYGGIICTINNRGVNSCTLPAQITFLAESNIALYRMANGSGDRPNHVACNLSESDSKMLLLNANNLMESISCASQKQ